VSLLCHIVSRRRITALNTTRGVDRFAHGERTGDVDSPAVPRLPDTDRAIRGLQPADRPVDYRDGGFHRGGGSLFLRVAVTGRKRWYFTYNRPSEVVKARGSHYPRATIAGDLFPTVGLAAARAWAAGMRSQVFANIDPKPARIAQPTLRELIAEYGHRVGKRARSWPQADTYLKAHVLDWGKDRLGVPLGDMPVGAITTPMLVDCLDAVVEGGAPASANRLKSILSPIFKWAQQRGRVEANPLAGLPLPAPKRSRDRTLSDREIITFWRLAEEVAPHRASWGLRLVLATGQRPGEVLCFEPSELAWEHAVNLPDGSRWEGAAWIIPKAKHKTGRRLIATGKADQARDHVVPLSGLAAQLFRLALDNPVSDDYPLLKTPPPADMNPAFHGRNDLGTFRREMEHWTPQDLRRTAYTGMTSLGIPRDTVEAVVGHSVRGVAGVYDRYSYLREKARALEAWGRHLDARVSGREAAVVRIG
jgi:integrase